MNKSLRACAVPFTVGASVLATFSNCSTGHGDATGSDHAYIQYWTPPQGSHKLRLAVKDLIDMKGVVTSAGSEFLSKHTPPAAKDAKCLEIARQRPVDFVGKTNLTEFAIGVSGVNNHFGTPRNPVTRHRVVPGGSSSGSAVAVANGTADVAFGTDTAGSIRVPAACCGIAGLKTTFGLVPLDGVYPIEASMLDTIGPMAKDVGRLAQGMDLLQRGFIEQYKRAVAATPKASMITIGRLYTDGTDPRIERAIDDALNKRGFRVVRLPDSFKKQWEQAEKDSRTVAAASAWMSDQKFAKQSEVRLRTKAVVALGALEYRNNYKDALRRRGIWQETLRAAFKHVNFVALPTMKQRPPRLPIFTDLPLLEAQVLALQNTSAVNLAGNPALALPVPIDDPVVPVASLQLIGPWKSEAALLNAGRLVEGLETPLPDAPQG